MKFLTMLMMLGVSSPSYATPIMCTSTPTLAVDADGAPNSYRVDGKGLSYTCDGVFAVINGVAHTQKNDKAHWQALCKQYWARAQATNDYSHIKIVGFLRGADGKPVVQDRGDPLPGEAYVTTTSLTVPGTPASAQRHFTNANEIPYVVLSSNYAKHHRLNLGDLVAVYRPATGRLVYGVYGDCCSLGEASVRLHLDLGSNPIVTSADGTRRAKHGIADRVVFVALPGTHTSPTLNSERWRAEIKAKGDIALAALGGLAAIEACSTSGR
jgi:hypothetical protein